MNREIKFRAWDKSFKIMSKSFQGELHIAQDQVHSLTELIRRNDMWEVMQYTGLKDKNGKEIYEGDIIKIAAGYYGDSYYKTSLAIVKWEDDRFYPHNPDNKYGITWQENYWDGCEVIGNIYENPELLK